MRWRRSRTRGSTGAPPAPPAAPPAPAEPEPEPRPGVLGILDEHVAAQLERDGYARLGPFLEPHEVEAAAAAFHEAWEASGQPLGEQWFPTILAPDDVRARCSAALMAIVAPRLDAVFDPDQTEIVRVDYSVKPPSPLSELGPHQDFTLIDEREARSFYLWIPLRDTDAANGTLHVVPGSHHFANRIRSRHVPSYFDEVLDLVHDVGVELECRAGELIVMVSGLIHYSPPNTTDEVRLAAHGIVKPSGVPFSYYFADQDTPAGAVERHELDLAEYLTAVVAGPAPGSVPTELEPRPPEHMTRERFTEGLQRAARRP